MSDSIQFHSRVGDDGVLNLTVNLGQTEAKKDVVVTIESAQARVAPDAASLTWTNFVERTYGSCAGLNLERHDQGQFEQRESIP